MTYASSYLCFSALFSALSASVAAQPASPVAIAAPVAPTSTTTLPTPTPTGILGTLDPAAIAEFTAHRLAVGGVPWTGMQASGQVVYGSASTSYPITLSNFGNRAYRLDTTTPAGTSSLRIFGFLGKQQNEDGSYQTVAAENCLAGSYLSSWRGRPRSRTCCSR